MGLPAPAPFNPEEFARTMQALKEGTSAADSPMRPTFDPVQHREVVAEAVHGRRIEDFRQALERAGFVYWPANSIPPGCESTNPLEPSRPIVEGQWRRIPDARLPRRLALKEAQVLAWFSGPEELWTWLRTMANQTRVRQYQRERQRPIKAYVPR
jgi:hypothetical protein